MNTNDPDTNDMNDANGTNRPPDPNGKGDSIGRENFGCDTFAEALALFVFGEAAELDDARRAALESHLVSCAACRSERDALLRSLELLKSESLRDAAPQLSAERQAKLMEEARVQTQVSATSHVDAPAIAGGRVVRIGRWAIAAGVLALAGAGWYAWQATGLASRHDDEVFVGAAKLEQPHADTPPPAFGERNGFDLLPTEPDSGSTGGTSIPVDSGGHGFTINPDDQSTLEDQRTLPAAPASQVAPPEPAKDSAEELSEKVERGKSEEKKLQGEEENRDQDKLRVEGETRLTRPSNTKGGEYKGPAETNPPSVPVSAPSRDAKGDSNGPTAPRTGYGAAPSTRGRASSSAAPSAAGGKTLASAPAQPPAKPSSAPVGETKDYCVETIDVAANTTADDEAALQLAKSQLETLSRNDGSGDLSTLGRLGYMADDTGGGGGGQPAHLDPALVGRLLAATGSPSDVVRVESHLAAALGIVPATPRADVEKDRDTIVREFLDRLSRRQNEPPRDMFFRCFGDHPFVSTRIDCKSTFGMDVDTASYALARAYLAKGMLPPKVAVRTEEFVNAFKHDLAPPSDDVRRDDARGDGAGRDLFAIHTELAPSPFGDDGQLLLQVGLKARTIPKAQRKPVALTFIIDVSGSMAQDGRLELVKKSLRLLVNQLDERDTIGIVSFESTGHRVLDPTNAAQRGRILGALDQLRPEGSTNADEGLRLGYDMALEQWRSSSENRVVLCSDGVANTGVTDARVLSARIAECKSKYIYLNCVGVGMGNHNDALMEQLADEGDGFCAYLDRIDEAKKLFVDRLTGTLMTVARNAKIQVEFDPASVYRFRQLGYEKRALAHRDFRNDRVDAGEVGAGQEVVALYEIEPKGEAAGPLATVRIRYEDPDKGEVREQARRVVAAEAAPTLAKTTPRFRLSACVAEFAEILRQSVHARDGSFGAIERLAEPLVDELKGDPDVPEFVALVEQAARLPDLLPPHDGLVRAVDEMKRLRCLREEARDADRDADDALMRQLEEQNRVLEKALRDALDRALRHS